MKLLAALFAVALGNRMNVSIHGPTNELSTLRSSYDTFMQAPVGSGRMTSWTGPATFSIQKKRRIHGAILHSPYWEIFKGDDLAFTWKSWYNPVANARRSVREGDKTGKTVNRVHYNQVRRLRARARAFMTTPGNRGQTYYTMSLLGWFGKHKENSEEWLFKVRENQYNLAVGKCSGSLTINNKCKGQLYTAKAYNFGYEIKVMKGDQEVAVAKLADQPAGGLGKQIVDNLILGEKKKYDVTVQSGQDNMAIAEFIGFMVDLEEYGLFLLR